ncbi:hypothetical protein GLOIN_2v1787703 [Rhizophagus irregularis DAOM 181602=DAOM 197198]|nr:hypothetical protein GLOIN_2v1787703 [Rhizophagus irregularis DAOM 181602=DAOM 197198]
MNEVYFFGFGWHLRGSDSDLIENDELKDKNTEIPELRRKFAETEAERAELKGKVTELPKQGVEESKRRDAENAKLKTKIKELESENVDFRDRITKVEQRPMLNDPTTVHLTSIWLQIIYPWQRIMKNHW